MSLHYPFHGKGAPNLVSCCPTRPASSRPCSVLDPPGTLETSPHDVERPCGAAFTLPATCPPACWATIRLRRPFDLYCPRWGGSLDHLRMLHLPLILVPGWAFSSTPTRAGLQDRFTVFREGERGRGRGVTGFGRRTFSPTRCRSHRLDLIQKGTLRGPRSYSWAENGPRPPEPYFGVPLHVPPPVDPLVSLQLPRRAPPGLPRHVARFSSRGKSEPQGPWGQQPDRILIRRMQTESGPSGLEFRGDPMHAWGSTPGFLSTEGLRAGRWAPPTYKKKDLGDSPKNFPLFEGGDEQEEAKHG